MLIVRCGERRVVREGRWIGMLVILGGFWEGQNIEELIYTMKARGHPSTDISAVSTLLRIRLYNMFILSPCSCISAFENFLESVPDRKPHSKLSWELPF